MKLVDPKNNPHLKVLFYGAPGSGKTRTVATAAADKRVSPCLMLGAANNPLSIRDYEQVPDMLQLEALEDLNRPYNWLAAGQPEDAPIVKEFGLRPPYKTIIVDGITEIQRFSFAVTTGSVDLGPGDFPKRVGRQEFGNVLSQMTLMARLFFGLDMNVLMTSLEKRDKDDVTGLITYAPFLWGQSDTEVGGYAYVVARLMHRAVLTDATLSIMEDVTEETKNIAVFKPSGKYVAKDQYGSLGDYMVDPSITKMLDLIYGGKSTTRQPKP